METLIFFPYDITYKIKEGKPYIYMYGKTKDTQICVIAPQTSPYFYVHPHGDTTQLIPDIQKITAQHRNDVVHVTKIEKCEKKVVGRETQLLKVYTKIPAHVPALKKAVESHPSVKKCYEYDILFRRRFLMDNNITPLVPIKINGTFTKERSRVRVFEATTIEQVDVDDTVIPRILSFDIETYAPKLEMNMEKNPIIMIAVYGKDPQTKKEFKKVVTWKRFPTTNKDIEFTPGEYEMLQRFIELVEEFKPDIITGYNTDGFDFPYIVTRARKYKLHLDIGLDYSAININERSNDVKVTGIVHLDLLQFIRRVLGRSLETNSYKLDNVARELLNEQKIPVDITMLAHAWDTNTNLERFALYNIHDARITYNLCTKILPNIEEIVKIVGLPLFDISRMSFSQLVENYIFTQCKNHNEIAPNKPDNVQIKQRRTQSYEGGFVFQPTPGLYNNIAIFDFRSLYPTIIISHNVAPSTYKCSCCHDIIQETNEWFCTKKKGFLSTVLENIVTRRMRIKEIIKASPEKNVLLEARSTALKLLANSFYGYLGFAPARWYSFESARNVTALGREHIQRVIEDAEKHGFSVVYGDSVPYDRRVFIQSNEGDIKIIKIGELYKTDWKGYKTISYTKNGKVEFRTIKRVIRHKLQGKLLKIKTSYGITIVTDQHSVYTFDSGLKLVHAGKLKKGDYLISLTRPKTEVKYNIGQIFDIAAMELGTLKNELRLYSDKKKFPAQKGTCPYCKKIVILSTHVHVQHSNRKEKIDVGSKFQFIGAQNAKAGKIPRYWKLDNDLAWLLGFYCAEGSVSDSKTESERKMLLSFGSQDIRVIQRVKAILDKIIGSELRIIKNFDNRNKRHMYYYRVQRIPIVAVFQYAFAAGKGSEHKKVPFFILNAEEKIKRSFIDGYLIGDGNTSKDKRYRTHFNSFSTKSKELAIGLQFLFKSLQHGKTARGKEIKYVAWKYRKDKPKIQSLRVQSAKKTGKNFCLAEIQSIEEAPPEEYVYDIEVEESHNFVDAEGMILVHNTDSVFMKLGKKTKEDALTFVNRINTKLPGVMELEYEGYYPAALFVGTKSSGVGAKKRYALLDNEGRITIKGFEAVRRNTSRITKEVQETVLDILLKEENIEKARNFVKDTVEQLRKHTLPAERVVVTTQIKKPLDAYAAIGPHVAVARRMVAAGTPVGPGTVVEYVITKGKGIIRERARLVTELDDNNYDAEYYINNQIIPAVEKIFEIFAISIENDVNKKDQTSLNKFFG